MPCPAQALSNADDAPADVPVAGRLAEALGQARAELCLDTPRYPLVMRLCWQGIDATAALSEPAFGRLTLRVEARLGFLPFTAEDAAARREALLLIHRFNSDGPDRWALDGEGRVALASATLLRTPESREELFGATSLVLLTLQPRLEQLQLLVRAPDGALHASRRASS